MPHQNAIYLHYFLIIAMTMQKYVFLKIFSVQDSQICKKVNSVVYHIRHFDFQKQLRNYTR